MLTAPRMNGVMGNVVRAKPAHACHACCKVTVLRESRAMPTDNVCVSLRCVRVGALRAPGVSRSPATSKELALDATHHVAQRGAPRAPGATSPRTTPRASAWIQASSPACAHKFWATFSKTCEYLPYSIVLRPRRHLIGWHFHVYMWSHRM